MEAIAIMRRSTENTGRPRLAICTTDAAHKPSVKHRRLPHTPFTYKHESGADTQASGDGWHALEHVAKAQRGERLCKKKK